MGKALTEDSETAASLSELRDQGVQHAESECSTRTAEDLRCYFAKNSVMRTRRSVLVGVSSAFVVAGCTGSDSEPTTEGDDDDSSHTEESFEILNPQLNGQQLDQYDVDFPADVTPEQLADEFRHQLEYDTQGASGTVESTIGVEYTDRTIPNTPLNEEIESDQYQDTETIEQEVEFPEHLIENLIESPRNIQANITVEDTETGQKRDREFTLNYADQFAENNYLEAFDPHGHIDSDLGDTELVDLEVEDGVITIEYNSDHEIGTDEFNSELNAGVYAGIVDETRTAYELNWTVNDSKGQIHHVHVDDGLAEEYLNGEPTRERVNDMRREILFNRLYT